MSDNEIQKEESLEELLERINSGEAEVGGAPVISIESDIGKDDYRAFLYHSVFKKSPFVLPLYIILPLAIALSFSFVDNSFNILTFLGMSIVIYIVMFGIVIFRTERSLKKIEKNSPELLRLTHTSFSFLAKGIAHAKNGSSINVPYKNLMKVSTTKKRIVLYFTGKKAMIIRNEDIEKVMPLDEFVSFIKSKIIK